MSKAMNHFESVMDVLTVILWLLYGTHRSDTGIAYWHDAHTYE